MRYINGVNRKQVTLFPEIIDEYVEANNPVRFIDAFVDSLDLKELSFSHAELEPTGRPPYHPADLLKLYIYGYLNRIRSSRCIEKECKRNVEVMWLLKKLSPDFKTIADFRKDNVDAIKKVCKEFVFLCKHLDLFGGELVAIDGSKFGAVNSKKRNFNEAKLRKKLKEIDEKIDMYFEELEYNDLQENNVNSPNAEELKSKIEQLKERGEEYRKFLGELKDSGETQISLTDPDSRAMVNNQRIEVCYNVEITVDSKHKLILDPASGEFTLFSCRSLYSNSSKYISIFSSISLSFFLNLASLKFLFFEFTALNLLPSIATSSPPNKSRCLHRKTNSLHTFFIASALSFLKSAMVLKSGESFLSNHITSTFLLHSFSMHRLERMRFR
jgi:transposase